MAQRVPMSTDFKLAGVQVSHEEVAVATELSGYRIAKILVEPGASVTAGQPLATFICLATLVS